MPERTVGLVVITVILLVSILDFGRQAHASTLLYDNEINELPTVSHFKREQIISHDPAILKDIGEEAFREIPLDRAAAMFYRASAELKLSSLELFSDRLFAKPGVLYLLDRSTLIAIDEIFNTHLIYEVKGVTAKSIQNFGQFVPKGTPFEIAAVLCGNENNLWVLYDFPTIINSKEYSVLGGRYNLFRTNKIELNRSQTTGRIEAKLWGRNSSTEMFRPLVGPMNIPIQRLVRSPNDQYFTVYFTHVLHLTFQDRPISKR